ncbi:hypothetical protein GQM30_08390 [Escherichia coli]|nr:hypothetical protein [Escherichia coli]MWT54099.1 hypothetical protein [Escherichia coli]MWT98288.1 hypothetical protein [Escherichia coli]
MATFGYGRVSTSQQDTENQRLELGQAGWQIDYWFADVVSGKVPAMQRKAFSEMLNKIRDGETLVVAKGRCEQVPDMRSSYSSGAHPRGTS